MITTLMMLLGLSGAGAGLYNVIKEPSSGTDKGRGGEDDGGGSSRRRRERKRAREESQQSDEGDGLGDLPPPKWGGRGKEVPFQTPKGLPDQEQRSPKPVANDLPDLGDDEDNSGYPAAQTPSKGGRSRDKNRKKETKPQSLEDIPLGEFGENEDDPDLAQNLKPRRDKPELSFSADDIISKNSKYSFHRRPLLNAEALIESDHVEEAIEIYTRTGDRIPDQEIKNKIQKNIKDLEEYIELGGGDQIYEPELPKGKTEEPKTKKDSKKEKLSEGQNADYQDFVSALKQVSEVFAESIAKAIQYAQSTPPGGGNQPQPPVSPGSPNNQPSAIDSNNTPQKPGNAETRTTDSGGGSPYTLPPPGAVGADFLHPLVYQFLKDAPPLPDYSHVGEKETKGNYENLLKSLNQGLMAPPSAGGPIVLPPNFPNTGTGPAPMEGASPAASGIVGPFYLPNPGQIQSDFQNLSEALSKATGEVENLGTIAGGMESALGANSKSKDLAGLDLPDDTFFSNDWKQFRDLPLVDRRSGKERRVNSDRRENQAGRKDRRSGIERRKSDKFKEREDYLKDKAVQKLESDVKKAQALPKSSLNDLLAPYFPSLPQRLNLPPGNDIQPKPEPGEKLDLPDPLTKDIPKEEEWIGDESEWFEETTKALRKEVDLPAPVDPYDYSSTAPKIGLPDAIDPAKAKSETVIETDDPIQVELMGGPTQKEELKIGLPDPDEVYRDRPFKKGEEGTGTYEDEEPELDTEPPEIEIVDGNLDEIPEATDTPDELAEKAEEEPEKIIHGVLELKPPEADDAPFLTLTYDFGKIPHAFRLSKNYSIMEYSYFKYKPMLMKAQEFARRKMLKNALNYYRVIKSQNIPPELRKMINRNIRDITEFMEKFLMAKGG
ncbi:hypothetical protein [Leptospira sp. 'Mane']|uniref:hypothetical protein n=1 Tax=Leptospira sp. 'Mane' TaxID=3387407 RepID=UPI00398B8BA6